MSSETYTALELLGANLDRVRIPDSSTRIFKEECCVSFDTPKSEGGLFVDLNSFLAFGKEYVSWNYEKTGNSVYLHIKKTRKSVVEDRPSEKPTQLDTGVGGFDNSDPEYEESHEIVILPYHATLTFPSAELPEMVRLAVDDVIMNVGAEKTKQVFTWTDCSKIISKHAFALKQLDKGIIVPPSGWKCEKCDKTENLWLNLTDGSILCGRRNWDGTGGNDHAFHHYDATKYPLAVKLGTITADLQIADVYSYDEDSSVLDPLLAQHLQHFSIDYSSLQKTEKTTAECELDQNTNLKWNHFQECGQDVQPLFGPGYTGLVNLGNSCYMAAIMQVMFSTRSFCLRYYSGESLKAAFYTGPDDPTVDLNMQLTKLAHGLLSGNYSIPATKKQEGIPPWMFKSVISAAHPEFSSMSQQDALEFFLHLIDQVELIHNGNPEFDPSRSFKFEIENRVQCPSGKVVYMKNREHVLSLSIPLHKASNRKQLEEFQKLKAEKNARGEEVSYNEIVRPRVALMDCLEYFSAPVELQGFYSTALNAKITAVQTACLASFPVYLVLHLQKFVMEGDWDPKKLDVYVDVPETIDISHMRSKGLQPGEELLPESGMSEHGHDGLSPNEDIVIQLASMGFRKLHCEKAAINTFNIGVEEAMNWLLNNIDNPDLDEPIKKEQKSDPLIDTSKLETLVSFGFEEEIALKALLETGGGGIEMATEWILNHRSRVSDVDAIASSSSAIASSSSASAIASSSSAAGYAALPDGQGKYRLIGFVSHIGTSANCGHYVAHINKDGRWVIFDDEKVGASKSPPFDTGYLYFFERLDS